MKNALKKTVIGMLTLGLTTNNVLAVGNGTLVRGKAAGGAFKLNHSGRLLNQSGLRPLTHTMQNKPSFNNQHFAQPTINRNQFANSKVNSRSFSNSTKNSFSQQQSINKNFNNNPQFIHSTPSFNNVNKNNIIIANNSNHATTFTNANNAIIHTGNTTTHIVTSGAHTNTVIHTTTHHVGSPNDNVAMRGAGPTIVNPVNKPIVVSGSRPIINNPVIINNKHVTVNGGYGYHYYGSPIIVSPYYYGGYYNNVNDFLAVALGLSLIGNVAQFAAAQSHTNTVVYQNYPVYPPYSANTMSVYQPIPYAPSTSTGSKASSTSSTSSQPVNVTVNTTVNTTTPPDAASGPATTTSTQSTTTATAGGAVTAANNNTGEASEVATTQATLAATNNSQMVSNPIDAPTVVATATPVESNPVSVVSGNAG